MDLRIGVDLMGGDQPPEAVFEAVWHVAETTKYQLVVFATPAVGTFLSQKIHPRIRCVITDEAIEMEESPLLAIRRKKKATMAVGIRLLKEGQIDAFLSTGNTGALVATALLHLNTLPSVTRPALLVTMPTLQGEVVVLDVGANLAPKPSHLVTYAHLGALFTTCYHDIEQPTIGLLNIGVEEQKGTNELKETYRCLQGVFKNRFLGNIEGREVFLGKVDVLVTDGFTGNVFLKTSEGISQFLVDYLAQNFQVPEILSNLNHTFNYAAHPGALLCGVDGLVIKCHGHSESRALINGIEGAADLVRKKVLQKMKNFLL